MIHKYKLGEHYILLDVHSGAIHLLDELCFDIIDNIAPPLSQTLGADVVEKLLPKYKAEEITECYTELYELYEAGQLFSVDDYEKFANMLEQSPIKAMCLHIAHDCNLRCEYCFASTGDYAEGRSLMSEEVGKKAIDFLLEKSGSRRNLELDFFGGEPLMNFEVVKKIVTYAREREKEYGKNFRFTITTNGMLLSDDKIDFINKEMYNAVLSVDGRPEVNDKVRKRVDGRGCYDRIVPNFQKLVAGRDPHSENNQYYVRGTFTKYNLDFAEDVLHMNDLGFDQVSIEPVVADPKMPYAITEADLPKIFDEYENLAVKLLEREKEGKGFNFFHFMLDLDQGPCAIKRLRGCGCGNEYVAITPEGDIYPCHQFVGMDEWKMGSLMDGTLNLEMKESFAHTTVYDKPDCRECWAKFYCSGGCNANNVNYMGSVKIPHKISCELEKKRLECAIMIKAEQAISSTVNA